MACSGDIFRETRNRFPGRRGEASKEGRANLMLKGCHRHTPAHPPSLTPSIHSISAALPDPSLAPRAQQAHPAKQRVCQAQELAQSEQREWAAGRGGHLAESQPCSFPSSFLKPQNFESVLRLHQLLPGCS